MKKTLKYKGGKVNEIKKEEDKFVVKYGDFHINIPFETNTVVPNEYSVIFVEGLGCPSFDYTVENENYKYTLNRYPREQVGRCASFEFKCHSNYKALSSIVTSSLGFTPLRDKFLFDLINEIIEKSITTNVIVVGHSFGGLIANRIAEIFIKIHKYVSNEYTEMKDYLNNIFNKLQIAGFGSVYIAKNVQEENVPFSITNYIAIGDVANTCTRTVCHIQHVAVKKLDNYKKLIIDETYPINIKYKKRESPQSNITDICFIIDEKPTCSKIINNIPIARAHIEWSIHNMYYNLIMQLLLKRSVLIENLQSTGVPTEM